MHQFEKSRNYTHLFQSEDLQSNLAHFYFFLLLLLSQVGVFTFNHSVQRLIKDEIRHSVGSV